MDTFHHDHEERSNFEDDFVIDINHKRLSLGVVVPGFDLREGSIKQEER